MKVDLFLADVEVLDVEEAYRTVVNIFLVLQVDNLIDVLTDMLYCVIELLDKLLFTAGLIVQAQIESDELGPVDYISQKVSS